MRAPRAGQGRAPGQTGAAAQDTGLAVAGAEVIERDVELPLPRTVLRILKQIQLMRRTRRHQLQRADADTAQRIGPQVRLLAQGQRRVEQLTRQVGRVPQRHAVTAPAQVCRAHAQLHRAALVPLQPQTRTHALGKRQQRRARVRLADEVTRRGGAVADGFRRRQILDAVHRRGVIPVGIGVQLHPALAEALPEHIRIRRRERADRADAQPLELPHRAAPGKEQAAHRQWPDHVGKACAVNDRHGVRLAVVQSRALRSPCTTTRRRSPSAPWHRARAAAPPAPSAARPHGRRSRSCPASTHPCRTARIGR